MTLRDCTALRDLIDARHARELEARFAAAANERPDLLVRGLVAARDLPTKGS